MHWKSLLFSCIFCAHLERRREVFSVIAPLHRLINRYFAASNFELVNVHFHFPPRGLPDELTLHEPANPRTSMYYFFAVHLILGEPRVSWFPRYVIKVTLRLPGRGSSAVILLLTERLFPKLSSSFVVFPSNLSLFNLSTAGRTVDEYLKEA